MGERLFADYADYGYPFRQHEWVCVDAVQLALLAEAYRFEMNATRFQVGKPKAVVASSPCNG